MRGDVIEGRAREIPRDIVVVPPETQGLAIDREPEIVLEEAHRAAAALKKVLDGKADPVMMGGQRYLEYEDWATVARFYGVTAKAEDSVYVELGNARGFKATAVALRGGEVISQATAYCLDDESKWSERPVYTWGYITRDGGWSEEDPGRDQIVWQPGRDGKNRPKRERRITGVEPVPLFQMSSMAQTRACAKALRNVLAWVVVLAGYKPTPAEELGTPGVPTPSQEAEPTLVSDSNDPLTIPEEPEAPPPPTAELPADPNGRVDDEGDPLWESWLTLRQQAAERGIRTPIITLPAARIVLASAADSMRRQLGATAEVR